MHTLLPAINADKNLYSTEALPLITIYDDNWFVRNDYDVLSIGQRNYLIQFFNKQGFKQKTGTILQSVDKQVVLSKPNNNLAVSNFSAAFIEANDSTWFAVTPTMFAEALFYYAVKNGLDAEPLVEQLIDVCPYNIEWLRDVSYRTEIEPFTQASFSRLTAYQKAVVDEKFKMKKAL